MIKSDAPIKSKREDLLGRSKFSESLGKALLEWKSTDSIVLGLYGKWGSGKSSVINLAIEYIDSETTKKKFSKKDKPIIIRFNPWNFTEQNQLITIFLSELAKAINYYDKGKDAKEIGHKLITYSKFFSVMSLIPGLEPYSKIFETAFKGVGKTTKAWGELQTKDLEQYKKEVDKTIQKLGRKIIIIIDDIDRLNEKEIKQIFQLVKQNANFPSTMYILSLDQDKALSQIDETSEFIEKIIQVSFHIPAIEGSRLQKILFDELDKILKPFPEGLWDVSRWNTIYFDGYRHLFTSIRNIKRYINSLQFNIAINFDEVNPLDFFVIEAIRVFYPTFYERVAGSKDLFVGLFFLDNDNDRNTRKTEIEKLFESVDEKHRSIVRTLIFELFPQVAAVYRNQTEREHENWFKEKRICAEKRFGNYFYLNIPEGELSQTEMNMLVSNSSDVAGLNKRLQVILKDGRIRRCLGRLPEFVDNISHENVENFILAFYNIADSISRDREGDLDFGVEMELVRLAYHLLKKLPATERFDIAQNIVMKSLTIESVVHFVSIEKDEHDKNKEDTLLSEDDADKLVNATVAKIKDFAQTKKLNTSPGLAYILYRWKRWGEEKEVSIYISDLIETHLGIISLIKGFAARTVGSGKKKYKIQFNELKDFIDLGTLKNYVVIALEKNKKSLKEDELLYLNGYIEGIEPFLKGEDKYF